MNSKIILSIAILFLTTTFLSARTNNSSTHELLQKAKEISTEGFLKYDTKLFQQSIGLCERVLSAEPKNSEVAYYLAYNQYRMLTTSAGNGNEDLFNDYSNSAIQNAEKISEAKGYQSEAKLLLAAIYMMKLAKDQSDAPQISTKIYTLLAKAQVQNPLNPRVYLVKGTMLFNTPEMFGGSTQKAIENFNKAISLFEREKETFIDWGYLETLAWKGQALTKLKKYSEAEIVYNTALKIEPDFRWVKYVLLPSLLKLKIAASVKDTKDSSTVSHIVVKIKGLNSNKGNVRIALYNSEENYNSGKPFRAIAVGIKNKTAKCTFDNIPYGEYAIKFYHDENRNKKIDKNFFRMPTEGYGFSNNATGNFGPASFEDAKFLVQKKIITVEMSVQ